jgi:hypothetical protein
MVARVFGRLKEQPSPQSLVGASTSPVPGSEPSGGGEGGGPREGVILLLFTVLTLALSAYVLITSEHDAVHDPVQKAARGEIKGLDPESLLREVNLRRALAKIDAGSRPLVTTIRIAPDRVDATVRDTDGSRKLLSIDTGFGVKENDFGVGDDDAVRTSQINAAGPERMLKAVAERTRMSPDAVDYVTMSFSSSDPQWYMSLDQGPARVRQWVAAPDGTDVRKPGELSQAVKDADAKRRRKLEAEQRRFQRQLARRSACLNKAQDATAAGRCIERFPL